MEYVRRHKKIVLIGLILLGSIYSYFWFPEKKRDGTICRR